MLKSARKLFEIFAAWLGLARIFLENELLENARLKFYFPCSKSPNAFKLLTKFIHSLKKENIKRCVFNCSRVSLQLGLVLIRSHY